MMQDLTQMVVIEGIDGSGKDTLAERLYQYVLNKEGQGLLTGEPHKSKWAGIARNMLARPNAEISELGFQFVLQRAFIMDRSEHTANLIHPALAIGLRVICVRYWLSTLAYGGEHMTQNGLVEMHHRYMETRMPLDHTTILLDLPASVAVERKKAAGKEFDAFETEAILTKVRRHYHSLVVARQDIGPVIIIDATLPPDEVFQKAVRGLGWEPAEVEWDERDEFY